MGGLSNKYKGLSGVESTGGGGGGSGDVVGPSSSTANALARYNGTTGKLIKNSVGILDDSGNLSGINNLSATGNLTLSGSAKKILGDFSNATRSNRLAVQTTTTNGNTRLPFLPNGTSRLAGIDIHDATDADNSSFLQVHSDGTNNHAGLNSSKVGTGTTKDLVFQIDSVTKAKINAADGKFNVDTLTASQLVGTDASKNLQSVTAATSSVGTDFAINYSGSTITFSIPSMSATATRGLLTNGVQIIPGNKTFNSNSTNFNSGTGLFRILPGWLGNAGVWLDMSTDGASGIGSGGTGVNPWVAYAAGTGQWFLNAQVGDICYRNSPGRLLFGNTGTANATLVVSGDKIGIGTTSIGSLLQIAGGAAIGYGTATTAPTNGLAVAGSSVFGDNLTISKNQNATASISVSNTTSGNASSVEFRATSDASAGSISFGKFSTPVSTYKIINSKDAFFFNGVAGDFAFLNDHAGGGFKFAPGASSTSQFTILSTGSVGVGTTTIGSKFQVNGNAAIGYSASTAAPTNGLDVSGNSLFGKGSANYIQIAGAATTLSPTISALGSDTNINLTLTPKGTGSIIASSSIILKSYTVATLPTGVEGMRAYVTDATAPTYLGTLIGGGAVKCPVFYNGTAWVSA